ncbi:hypothetical protein C8R45DRAFT_939211 [Mycena sanguinolenta]|nr:hypothetical protein C8R45DRAFT_939211 [Mycena sanguinolenta]
MSAETLRARIAELEIELQTQLPKKLLKKLQNDKSHAQRQLNELLDPIARLPLEISSEIFLRALNPFWEADPTRPPMLFLRVCKTWTAIAVSTSALWTSIQIHFPCGKSFRKWILPAWLDRARTRPLSVSFGGNLRYWNYRVSDMIWQHAGQLQYLEISSESEDDSRQLFTIDIFGQTSPTFMPLLQTLTIRRVVGKLAFLGHQILELLRRMPNLLKFHMEPQYHLLSAELVVIPTLRQLWFGDSEEWYDEILDFLSLPALENLAVSMDSSDDLLRFMIRSAPPLQDLEIAFDSDSSSIHLLQCLRLIPSLVSFRMLWPEVPIVEDFFAALADSPSLLPNLRRLIVHPEYDSASLVVNSPFIPSVLPEASWRTLVRVLSTRRTQLSFFALEPVKGPLASDVLAALSELGVDGMQIYIGDVDEESNFATSGFPLKALRYDDRWWE